MIVIVVTCLDCCVRATLGQAGHRMVNHHAPRPAPGTYSNVPPPMYGDNNRGNYYQQRGKFGFSVSLFRIADRWS